MHQELWGEILIVFFSRYSNDESIKLEIAMTIKSITDSFESLLLVEEVRVSFFKKKRVKKCFILILANKS